MTWDQRFREYLTKNSTLTVPTINNHVSRLRLLAAWMRENLVASDYHHGNIERIKKYGLPSAADKEIIYLFFNAIAEKHPADYRQHIKAALRHYYSFLIIEGSIKEAPELDIPIRKNGKDRAKDVDVLVEHDIKVLHKYFGSGKSAIEMRDDLIFECLIQLGIRKGELLMLRYGDFNHTINQVTIRSTKTEGKSKYGGTRIMPLSDILSNMIVQYKGAHMKDELIFNISGHTVWQIIKKAGIALGMPWLTPHKFRHYCITKFSQLVGEDGVTPIFNWKELSAMFGVSPEVIAQRYDHPSPENIVSKALKSGVYSDE